MRSSGSSVRPEAGVGRWPLRNCRFQSGILGDSSKAIISSPWWMRYHDTRCNKYTESWPQAEAARHKLVKQERLLKPPRVGRDFPALRFVRTWASSCCHFRARSSKPPSTLLMSFIRFVML